MGTMSTLCVYATFHMGLFFDYFGARASYALGCALTLGGWLLVSWALARRLPAWQVGLCLSVASQVPLWRPLSIVSR